MLSVKQVPATLYEAGYSYVQANPVEFEWNENWFEHDELNCLLTQENWSLDEINTVCGLVKRILSEFGKRGLSRSFIGYHQAQSMAIKTYRRIKARAEQVKQANARKAAARSESDRLWGDSMHGQVNARGGIIAPFNNRLYRNAKDMVSDAQALGYIHVGNENVEKAVMHRRRDNQSLEQPRIKRRRADAIAKALHQHGFTDDKLRNVRLRVH